jgi:hypothetical protein
MIFYTWVFNLVFLIAFISKFSETTYQFLANFEYAGGRHVCTGMQTTCIISSNDSLLSTGKHFQLCGDPIHESRIRLNYLIGTQESVHRQPATSYHKLQYFRGLKYSVLFNSVTKTYKISYESKARSFG